MSDIIDLDALLPEPKSIKFGGETISIPPPTTADILRLGSLANKLDSANRLNTEELEAVVNDIVAQIYKCIPSLNGKPLGAAQVLKLVSIISEMAVPKEAKELADRGITPDTPKTNP